MGQWKTRVEERKPLDSSPAAIKLALLPTDEELDSLEKGANSTQRFSRKRNNPSLLVSGTCQRIPSPPAFRIGVITEADRSATTLLLPEEY